MFNDAWEAVMRSPSGWHDRTPVSLVFDSRRITLTIRRVGLSAGCQKVQTDKLGSAMELIMQTFK